MENQYTSNMPLIYALLVVIVFLFMTVFFVRYDCVVSRRQKKMIATTKRTTAIVSSLFPANVRDRILKNAEEETDQGMTSNGRQNRFPLASTSAQLKDYIDEHKSEEVQAYGSKPIADLFPSATVMVRLDIFIALLYF